MVLAVLWDKIVELKDIMQFVCAHNDALEQRAYQDVDEVLQIIADTARVTPMEIGIHGRGAKMVWGVYIKSPMQDIQAHKVCVNIVSTLNYCTPFKGASFPVQLASSYKCK